MNRGDWSPLPDFDPQEPKPSRGAEPVWQPIRSDASAGHRAPSLESLNSSNIIIVCNRSSWLIHPRHIVLEFLFFPKSHIDAGACFQSHSCWHSSRSTQPSISEALTILNVSKPTERLPHSPVHNKIQNQPPHMSMKSDIGALAWKRLWSTLVMLEYVQLLAVSKPSQNWIADLGRMRDSSCCRCVWTRRAFQQTLLEYLTPLRPSPAWGCIQTQDQQGRTAAGAAQLRQLGGRRCYLYPLERQRLPACSLQLTRWHRSVTLLGVGTCEHSIIGGFLLEGVPMIPA